MSHVKELWADPARKGGKGKRWLAVWTGPDGRKATKAFAVKQVARKYAAAQEVDVERGTYTA